MCVFPFKKVSSCVYICVTPEVRTQIACHCNQRFVEGKSSLTAAPSMPWKTHTPGNISTAQQWLDCRQNRTHRTQGLAGKPTRVSVCFLCILKPALPPTLVPPIPLQSQLQPSRPRIMLIWCFQGMMNGFAPMSLN